MYSGAREIAVEEAKRRVYMLLLEKNYELEKLQDKYKSLIAEAAEIKMPGF
jgi:hypothetical protein